MYAVSPWLATRLPSLQVSLFSWLWLMGEFSLRVTLGGGMAGLGVLGWGGAPWGLGLLGGGSVSLGVALLNAGRKSPMTGGACLGLACVIGGVSTLGLWLGAVLLSRLLGGA